MPRTRQTVGYKEIYPSLWIDPKGLTKKAEKLCKTPKRPGLMNRPQRHKAGQCIKGECGIDGCQGKRSKSNSWRERMNDL